jgi:hypothetical protein
MLALELAMGLFLGLGLFQRSDLCLGQHLPRGNCPTWSDHFRPYKALVTVSVRLFCSGTSSCWMRGSTMAR